MLSSPSTTKTKEDRKFHRIGLALPMRVEGRVDKTVSWDEVTRLSSVSAFGAGFNLKRPVKRGRLILLTIPLPRQLRCYDFMEPQYKIWGLVRYCVPISKNSEINTYAIGVAFIGKRPPLSYTENPAKLYEVMRVEEKGFWQISDAPENPDESTLPKEHRRHSRLSIPISVFIEVLDSEGNIKTTEMTVTENISLGGAALFTSLSVEKGTFIRLNSEQYNISIISIVRGSRIGKDGVMRLHIEFIDHFFPLEGFE